MVGLTTAPGAAALSTTSCGGGNGHHEIYPYADYAFLGVESASVATDPQAGYYQWRTSTDGWHVTNVPRKVNNICHGSQTWRHLEIVVHPFSGRGDDIEFLIDGVVVGQGHRTPGATCAGLDFQRIQLGGRFPEQSDVDLCRPPYSYEHFWFDDVALTAHPAALLPCPNRVLRYDADGDGDVDMTDFAAFQRCYTPNINSACPCRCMDGDADGSIDAADLETFLLCVSGDHIPADITCDDALP